MIDGLQRVDAGHSAKLETEHDGFVVLTSVTHVLANQHEIRSESSAERELGKELKKKKISLGYELFPTDPLFCNRKEKEQIIKRPQDGVEYVYSEGDPSLSSSDPTSYSMTPIKKKRTGEKIDDAKDLN